MTAHPNAPQMTTEEALLVLTSAYNNCHRTKDGHEQSASIYIDMQSPEMRANFMQALSTLGLTGALNLGGANGLEGISIKDNPNLVRKIGDLAFLARGKWQRGILMGPVNIVSMKIGEGDYKITEDSNGRQRAEINRESRVYKALKSFGIKEEDIARVGYSRTVEGMVVSIAGEKLSILEKMGACRALTDKTIWRRNDYAEKDGTRIKRLSIRADIGEDVELKQYKAGKDKLVTNELILNKDRPIYKALQALGIDEKDIGARFSNTAGGASIFVTGPKLDLLEKLTVKQRAFSSESTPKPAANNSPPPNAQKKDGLISRLFGRSPLCPSRG